MIKDSCFRPNLTTGSGRYQQFFCARLCYIPCVDVVWLEPPAVQEELVKCPTFHDFADPIMHNIVVKDIFAWVYLVSTEQITNRMSLQIIEIGYHG